MTEHEQNQLPIAFELVLETDSNTNDIIIEVDLMLVQYMKQHQSETKFDKFIIFICLFFFHFIS